MFSGGDQLGPDNPGNFARSQELDDDFNIIYTEFSGGIDDENIRDTAGIVGTKLNLQNHIDDSMVSPVAGIQGLKLAAAPNGIPEEKYNDKSVSRRAIALNAATKAYEDTLNGVQQQTTFVVPGPGGGLSPYYDLLPTQLEIEDIDGPDDTTDIMVWFSCPCRNDLTPTWGGNPLTNNNAMYGKAYVSDGIGEIESSAVCVGMNFIMQGNYTFPPEYNSQVIQGQFIIPNVTPKTGAPLWNIGIRLAFAASLTFPMNFRMALNAIGAPGYMQATIGALVLHR